jgi:hypothetical protein
MDGTRTIISGIAIGMLVAGSVTAALTQKAENLNKNGWMRNGYGTIKFSYENNSTEPAEMILWKGEWFAKGEKIRDWSWDKTKVTVPAGEKASGHLTAWMPPNVADASGDTSPVTKGVSVFVIGGETTEVPFEVTIPVARIMDPMKEVKGKLMGLNLREKSFEGIKNTQRTLDFLDGAYLYMQDLTGFTPFEGNVVILEESPANNSWAYAGNPIVLNEKFVREAITQMDEGTVCCGWVHEMGHDFDFGGWYIWNSPAAEFQANFKLAYAVENLMTEDSPFKTLSWQKKVNGKRSGTTGRDFVDGYFMASGDNYLASSERDWTAIKSDEIHAMFLRLVRRYGWDPIKKWYRSYDALAKKGYPRPETAEGKVKLMCALLSKHTGQDLQPMFKLWKFPVTAEDVQKMNKKYKLDKLEIQI